MRTTPICLLALLLTTTAHASAPKPQVTDPTGDANVAGLPIGVGLPAYDITSIRWWSDTRGQHVTLGLASPDPTADAIYKVTAATPSCATVTVWYEPHNATTTLAGCAPRQIRWLAAPVWSASGVTFTLPSPSWFAKGTTIHALGADTTGIVDFTVGAVYPPVDRASGPVTYVLGS